jgi:hypothetical protein
MVNVASFWIADASIFVPSNLATKTKTKPYNYERYRDRPNNRTWNSLVMGSEERTAGMRSLHRLVRRLVDIMKSNLDEKQER